MTTIHYWHCDHPKRPPWIRCLAPLEFRIMAHARRAGKSTFMARVSEFLDAAQTPQERQDRKAWVYGYLYGSRA